MLSYWEKKNLIQYDLILVGAGFVGLSTAIHYKEKHPGRSVLVLERGVFPSGASTRNAGFACFGSLSEIAEDLENYQEDEAFELVTKRRMGIKNIRSVFGDEAIDYSSCGGFDLIRKQEAHYMEKVEGINALLSSVFGGDVFEEVADPKVFGFSDEVLHVVRNRFEGQLDPAKYIQCLWKRCRELNIQMLTGAEVIRLDEENCRAHVRSYYDEEIVFQSRLMGLCSNAFIGQLLPEVNDYIRPGRGMIMVSEPIKDLRLQGTFHMERGYVYFRNVDGRLLLGGGRNVSEEDETTTERGINEDIKAYLQQLTKDVISPENPVSWEMEWSGTMAFGQSKKPILRQINPRVAVGVRLGGMGVALGWETGKELASLLGD
ncbi:NAD(P)/FAD-dependent oxidoreductase [Echinicola vietnamensis]|uniref:Glycine/D-amino acid oxidase, deaminating n=1 Tax=Echinicola vietnamensis (strain DSM 17526 / LMG 23754 / KMM 6221) TaxID=926556 RepID=L0G2J9_ECHVK|nr:FAD-dependent oxidoreductase [Echinicola vietnamensis]AGA79055.1 glycine/D-amino acid oxidase, deaminating [Echinicola vietnamensis DSM 17526]